MPETVRNLQNKGSKMVILRLNDGSYVNIPAHGSCEVDSAMLSHNSAFDTLCKRGVIGEVEPEPEHERKKAGKADRRKPATSETKVAGEEAEISAAGDEMPKAAATEKRADEAHGADRKTSGRGGEKKPTTPRATAGRKKDKG